MPNQYKTGTFRLLVRIPDELHIRLQQAADAANTTMSNIARDAITDRLDLLDKLLKPGKPDKK